MRLRRLFFIALTIILGAVKSNAQEIRIQRIIDGDTFELNNGRIVHLIGVNAPGGENGADPGCPVTEKISQVGRSRILGDLSRQHAETWLRGQIVRVEFEGRYPDLAAMDTLSAYLYVIVGGRRIAIANELMVADGFAQACLGRPYRLQTKLLMSQHAARRRGLGLWEVDREHRFPGAGLNVDVRCEDFASHEEAEEFFVAEGGPDFDPFLLDTDRDGIPCEMLVH